MKPKPNFFLPLIIVAAGAGIAYLLIKNTPKQKRHKSDTSLLTIEAITLKLQDYQIVLKSRGTVKPRIATTLFPEISGRIVIVSENFKEGRFFDEGEVLLQIDDRNYQAAVKIANSELISARLLLEQEKVNVTNFETQIIMAESSFEQAKLTFKEEAARGEQAMVDWERVHPGSKPDELVLRKPQLAAARAALAAAEASLIQNKRNRELRPHQIAAAEAQVEAAKARLEEKKLDLERTRIIAPFTGIILTKNVDIGQYITQNTALADIYAVDYVEIRLPLSNQQLGFIDLPGQYRSQERQKTVSQPSVTLTSTLGLKKYKWGGKIIRSEGAFDTESRQLFVVAKVDNPYGRDKNDRPPLKIGQFVEAEISGMVAKNAIVIPRTSVRTGNEVLIVTEDNTLLRRAIKSFWSDAENMVISEGLSDGEILCITPLNFAVDGVSVAATVDGIQTENSDQSGMNSDKNSDHKKGSGKK